MPLQHFRRTQHTSRRRIDAANHDKTICEHAIEPLRILFLTHYFPPEGNAPANRTYEHSRRWASSGHDVTVVTCAPNCPDGRVYEGYANRWLTREMVDGIEVFRVWTYIAANKGFGKRIINYLSYFATAVWRSLRLRSAPDVIIATTPQFFCGWAGVLVKLMLRRPLILEVRDLWPDSIAAVGAMNRRSLLYKTLSRLETEMYRRADKIVTVGEGYRRELLKKRGVSSEQVSIIMNGVEETFGQSARSREEMREELGVSGKFVVCYAGTIGMAANLSVVIESAELARRANLATEISFLLIGSGAEKDALVSEVTKRDLRNVTFIGKVPREKVPDFLAAADAVLVHLRKSPLFETVIPSKLFEAALLGKPVILGVKGAAVGLLRELGNGVPIEPDSPAGLLKACTDLAQDRDFASRLACAGRDVVLAKYTRRSLASKYLRIVANVARAGVESRN